MKPDLQEPIEGWAAWVAHGAAPGRFFGVNRTGKPVRLSDLPYPKRTLRQRIRDAWAGAINGWKWGGT